MAAPLLEFEIKGLDDVLARLRAFGAAGQTAAMQAVNEEAERIKAESQQLVPDQYGTLERSATVVTTRANEMITATIGYGAGASAPYALAVHEHLSEHSPRSWKAAEAQGHPVQFAPGRGPKFLERPFLAATKGMADRIGAAMRASLARLTGAALPTSAGGTRISSVGGGGTRGGGVG